MHGFNKLVDFLALSHILTVLRQLFELLDLLVELEGPLVLAGFLQEEVREWVFLMLRLLLAALEVPEAGGLAWNEICLRLLGALEVLIDQFVGIVRVEQEKIQSGRIVIVLLDSLLHILQISQEA